jgi:preprotein translocase subunit YajC
MAVVGEYADLMKELVIFPPIEVFYDGESYWVADGFHRLAATMEAGFKEIIADVRQGTHRDALLYSAGANSSHGLRRTNGDKRRAVGILLKDEEWAKWSDREIARKCGVSDRLVNNIRSELSGANGSHLTERIGGDGKTYTVKERHWAAGGGTDAFWARVRKYQLGNYFTGIDNDLLKTLQKGAKFVADLTMTKDEAFEALRKLAIDRHSTRFQKGGYVCHNTGRFGKVREIMADALDVDDFKTGMQNFWQIDGCTPITKEEWETTSRQTPQAPELPKPTFEQGDTVTTTAGHTGTVTDTKGRFVHVETVNGVRPYKAENLQPAAPPAPERTIPPFPWSIKEYWNSNEIFAADGTKLADVYVDSHFDKDVVARMIVEAVNAAALEGVPT